MALSPTLISSTWSQASLNCYKWNKSVKLDDFPVAANQVIPKGGTVACVTAATATDVQTLTLSTPVGNWFLTFGTALQYNTLATSGYFSGAASAAVIQAALQALPNIGPGGCTVTGASTTRTITFTGALASQPQPLMVLNTSALASGSITIAHTTQGVQNGSIVNYNGALTTSPTTAPTLTATGSAGTIGAGTFEVSYSFQTAFVDPTTGLTGETVNSTGAFVTLTSAQSIQVTSITGIPSYVTAVQFYLAGLLVDSVVPSGGATGTVTISAAPSASAPGPRSVNTAYQASDGSAIPIGFAWYAYAAAPNGLITEGNTNPSGNEYGRTVSVGNVAIAGYFPCANINNGAGPDQNTVNRLGRLYRGSLTTGVIVVTGA